MAVTGVKGKPAVVKLGGAEELRNSFVEGGTYEAGDLIRINVAGEVVQAGTTSATDGAIQGIALQAGTDSGAIAPVLMFANDTVVSIPCVDTVAPEDLSAGTLYTLEVAEGAWGVTATATAGVVTVVETADQNQPWSDPYGTFSQDATVDNNRVLVKFAQAMLDVHGA